MQRRNTAQRRREQLRAVAWAAVVMAVAVAGQDGTDALQRRIGLLLAVTLAGYLMATKRNTRTTAKKNRKGPKK